MTNRLDQEEKYGDCQGAPHHNNPPVGATGVFGLEADGHGFTFLGLQGLAKGKKNTGPVIHYRCLLGAIVLITDVTHFVIFVAGNKSAVLL